MKRTIETLQEELQEAQCSSWDGKNRMRESSDDVQADDHVWGIVSDHGNVELSHKGRNGRVYFHGGLV